MKRVSFDTETELIRPGVLAPRLVCGSFADGRNSEVHDAAHTVIKVTHHLQNPDVILVGHNVVYDLAVCWKAGVPIDLIFKALDEGRIECTKIIELLEQIKQGTMYLGRPSLQRLAAKYLKYELDKTNTPRLEYHKMVDVPIEQWPADFIEYSRLDAQMTLAVRNSQTPYNIEECHRQLRADWALHLMGVYGMRADDKAVAKLKAQLHQEMEVAENELVEAELLKRDKNGKVTKSMANIKAAVEKSHPKPPTTEKGSTKTDAKTLKACNNPLLNKMIERSSAEKTLSFVEVLEKATEHRFTPAWNVLVETGRTSCGSKHNKGNLQNQPRKGGVRDCWIPADGHWFIFADYATAEVRTLAQNLVWRYGKSVMADVLNSGADVHQWFADKVGLPTRQAAKAAIFGIPGGLGAASLQSYARDGYGVSWTLDEAKKNRQLYMETFDQMPKYFDDAAKATCWTGSKTVTHKWSGRIRGDVRFTQACNTPFQGDAADGAKLALYEFTKRCYVGDLKDKAIPVAFVHDEIICECTANPEVAYDVAIALKNTMIKAFEQVTPDIKCVVEYACAERWLKGAEAVIDTARGLLPWSPRTDF